MRLLTCTATNAVRRTPALAGGARECRREERPPRNDGKICDLLNLVSFPLVNKNHRNELNKSRNDIIPVKD